LDLSLLRFMIGHNGIVWLLMNVATTPTVQKGGCSIYIFSTCHHIR